jgi:DNA-binding protein H-NS
LAAFFISAEHVGYVHAIEKAALQNALASSEDRHALPYFASESPLKYYLGGCKMTKYDFERMPLDDLWSLHEQICSVLETKIKDEKRKLEHRLDELDRRSVAAQTDIRRTRPSPKGEPKYRNPDDPSITWSGRGRHPRWVNELLAAGRAIDDFRIAISTSWRPA